MASYLREDGKDSSMRLGFILAFIAAFMLMQSVVIYIITLAVKGVIIPNWDSMGVFVLGLGGLLTGVGWVKAKQKKIENECKDCQYHPDNKEKGEGS